MKVTLYPKSKDLCYFSENPIILKIDGSNISNNQAATSVLVTVFQIAGNLTVPFTYQFRGTFYNNIVQFNLSPVLRECVNTDIVFPFNPANSYYPKSMAVIMYRCEFFNANNELISTYDNYFMLLAGGISASLFKKVLNSPYSNIFNLKIFKQHSQKLLTNRNPISATWNEIKECPFCFFIRDKTTSPHVFIQLANQSETYPNTIWLTPPNNITSYTIWRFNLYASFKSILKQNDVQIDSNDFFFIVTTSINSVPSQSQHLFFIKDSPKTAQSRVLVFRNSWGVFEALEVTGEFTEKINRESELYGKYDILSDSFESCESVELEVKNTFTGVTALMNKERLNFMREFYNSREVYLVEEHGYLTKVILTETNQTVMTDKRTLTSLPVTFTIAQNDTKFSDYGEIVDVSSPDFNEDYSDDYMTDISTTTNYKIVKPKFKQDGIDYIS